MAINMVGSGGSGLDINSIVSQLMQVERQPLLRLQQKEAAYQAKISAYATLLSSVTSLKSAISDLTASGLIGRSATVSDTTFMTASATSSASAGTYNIKINNIATAQSIYSTIFASESSEVADLTTYATQKLKIQVGSGTAAEITINSSNNTLSGIRDAINNANAGVNASIINDGTGYRLVLAVNSTGASNRIVVKVDEDNNGIFEESAETDSTGLSRLAFNPASYDGSGNPSGGVQQMTQSQAAVDAKIKVNNLEITRSSNTITDVITGVTLNLLKGDSYATSLTLQISEDSSSLTTKISSFVSAYNSTMNVINGLKGNITQTGVLAGDSTLVTLAGALRSVTTTRYGTGNTDNTLSYLGITHDKNGVLGFDSSKLSTAISSDADNVTSIINQMATSFESTLSNYINTIIPAREEGYQQTVENIQEDEEKLDRRLQLTEIALRNKFIALDKLLNQLQGTNTYVTQQMDLFTKISGGNK
ncbi:MAG: flagellar filament capping protein FliD [Nitrospirota bacterium]